MSCCPCLCVLAHILPCNAHKHAKKVYGSDPAAAEGSIRVQPPTPLRFLHPRSLSLSLSLSHTHTHKHSENVQPPDLSFSISLTNSVPLSILLSSRSGSQARIPHNQNNQNQPILHFTNQPTKTSLHFTNQPNTHTTPHTQLLSTVACASCRLHA